MGRKIIPGLFLLALLMMACSTERPQEKVGDTAFVSTIANENCCICGSNSEHPLQHYLGQDNLALISLNTFDFHCIEINRYDDMGELIEKATGTMQLCAFVLDEISASIMCDVDRGHASINITSPGNVVDAGSLGAFLCQDCLDVFSDYTYKPDKIQEIAVINLLTKELRPLEENFPWFTFDNYIVNLDFEDDGRVDIDIIYRPLRYEGPEE